MNGSDKPYSITSSAAINNVGGNSSPSVGNFQCRSKRSNVRCGSKADFVTARPDVRFSNRPFGVKRFQTIHDHSVDVARGLVLLFGIGTKALPSSDSKTRWNNLYRGLTVRRTIGPSGHANSPHPSSREGHHSTARWSFSNRPFRVKRFQAIHHFSVDVARGLMLLFGIGTKALPSWDSKTRWNNLLAGLAVIPTRYDAGSKPTASMPGG